MFKEVYNFFITSNKSDLKLIFIVIIELITLIVAKKTNG